MGSTVKGIRKITLNLQVAEVFRLASPCPFLLSGGDVEHPLRPERFAGAEREVHQTTRGGENARYGGEFLSPSPSEGVSQESSLASRFDWQFGSQ